MATLTWADLANFITEAHSKEGARPNPDLYLTLANEALGIISRQTEIMDGASWSNAQGGELSLSGASCLLPGDVLRITRVEWDGGKLDRMSEEELDAHCPGWRTATGIPTAFCVKGARLIVDCTPSGSVQGKLVIRGVGTLPPLSDDPAAENPLVSFPEDLQRAPAFYVLRELPVDPNDQRQVLRQATYHPRWEQARPALVSAIEQRKFERFKF